MRFVRLLGIYAGAAVFVASAALLCGCIIRPQIMDGDGMVRTEYETDGEEIKPVPTLIIEVNGKQFSAAPEKNLSAEEFIDKLSREALTLELSDYGGFEKTGRLPWELPTEDAGVTAVPGDIMLFWAKAE